MKNLLSGPVIINATLFQITWFACAVGSAHQLLWPALLSCGLLAAYQLQPKNRHRNDLLLIIVSVILGLIIDSLWVQFKLISYSAHTPFTTMAPLWIIILWIGFALTIKHSLSWLELHPLLPALCGLIFAPLSYYAGVRLGALNFTGDPIVVTASLALAWAFAMTVLVKVGKLNNQFSNT